MGLKAIDVRIIEDHICTLDDNDAIQLIDLETELEEETEDTSLVVSKQIEQK